MIRLVQRRLIIPRGDTGTFSVPVLSSYNSGDAAVFSIIDPRTHRRVYNQLMYVTDNVLSVKFEHGDTVNLPVGKFLWDIKFYQDPIIEDNQVVSGKEVDSYYAAFTMPECEIRQTGDNMLTADDAPGSTLTPQHINAINAALFALNEAVEKTETNVTHYPTIIDGEWNVWDANLGDYTTTGIEATGNGIASIEKTNTVGLVDTYTVNFTDGTTFLYNITNGDRGIGISSVSKGSTSGLVDTYIIAYTDGTSTSFTVTNGAIPNISIGTVQEGPIAAASITGTAANPVLNLTLPNANVPTRVSELENDAGYLTDVQINNTSITQNGVADIPIAAKGTFGVVKSQTGEGILISSGILKLSTPLSTDIKGGENAKKALVPYNQHESTFYGLAKAAGDITQSQSNNAVGTYTNEAKAAIQTMLDVPSNGEMNTAIGTAIGQINSFDMAVVQTLPTQDISTHTIYLVPKTGETNDVYDEYVYINSNWEMVGNTQIDLSDYALKSELPDVPVQDVQVNGASVLSNGVAEIPMASSSTLGTVRVNENLGIAIINNGTLIANTATAENIKSGGSANKPIAPYHQHEAAFYGLAKAAGDSTQSASENAVGTYTDEAKAAIQQMLDVPSTDDIPEVPVQDVQVNGASVVQDGVANVPFAGQNIPGVVVIAPNSTGGISVNANNGRIATFAAVVSELKTGTDFYKPVVPAHQHESTFYGLAKAAGDSTQSASNNVVGVYTDNAKASIKSMLGIVDGSTSTVDVSGITPTITGVENTRYVCGEVTSLDFTPAASGICIVRFTSGSTVTVLTIPSTVKFPEWFDPTSLETNTIYEICITDGVYGAVMSWAQ